MSSKASQGQQQGRSSKVKTFVDVSMVEKKMTDGIVARTVRKLFQRQGKAVRASIDGLVHEDDVVVSVNGSVLSGFGNGPI